MCGNTVATHLSTHAHTLEHLSGIRAGTDRTGLAQTVILTVSALAYATKAVTLHYALETMSLGSCNNIHISSVGKEVNGECITQIQLLRKTCELGQVSLGCHTSLGKVTLQRSRYVLLLSVSESKLNGIIAILLYALHLSDNTRTQFDNSAWYILTLGTENGSHSDFLS